MKQGNFLPTPSQRLLLDAALREGSDAIAAWEAWVAIADQVDFDGASQRLAPLVYRNLSSLGVEHPLLTRFKGFYRRAWYHNTLMIRRAAELVEKLDAAGIPTMMIKGIALCGRAYPDMATRPMADIDMVVPRADAVRAVAAMEAAGWRAKYPDETIRPDWQIAASFVNDEAIECDLHFSIFHEDLAGIGMADIWKRRRPLRLAGGVTSMPSAADLLLHIVAHGFRSGSPPPIRWIADAVLLLRAEGDGIDWDVLVRQARVVRIVHTVRQALGLLAAEYGCVPRDALERFAREPVSLAERLEFMIGRNGDERYMMPVHFMRSRYFTPRYGYVFGVVPFLRARQNLGRRAAVFFILRRTREAGIRLVSGPRRPPDPLGRPADAATPVTVRDTR